MSVKRIFTDVVWIQWTCSKKEVPRITPKVKTVIKNNSRVYRKWVNRGQNLPVQREVWKVRNATNKLIKEAASVYTFIMKFGTPLH